jgi:nucleoside-specific outer membrane channel protein Tsx
MRRSHAFIILVLLVLWITPALFAGDNAAAASTQPADSSTTSTSASGASAGTASTTTTTEAAKAPAAPEGVFSINQVEVFYTGLAKPDAVFGYGTTDHDLLTFQFEHFSFHSFGDIYVDAEVYQGRNVGDPYSTNNNWQSLLVLNPNFSLGKITKKKFALGPITDVSIVTRFERESYPDTQHFYTRNFGPSLNFKVPGFVWFESGFLARWDNINRKNTYLWRSVLLSKPLKLGTEKFNFNLLSLINGTRSNGTSIFERADLLWEVPHYNRIQFGMRTEVENYSNDPLSTHGSRYKRVMPEAMIKYIF